MTRDEALKLREIVEQAMQLLDDETLSKGTKLLSKMKKKGGTIKAGTRINWNGTVKRAIDDICDMDENNPDNNPSLWADIDYKNGHRIKDQKDKKDN